MNKERSGLRNKKVKAMVGTGTKQWSVYPQQDLASPGSAHGEA